VTVADRKPAAERATLARLQEIAAELDDLLERLRGMTPGEVAVSLLERATELAEEASRLLEELGSPA
jgi:hypothetical protein